MAPMPAKVANTVKFQDSGPRKSDKPRAPEFKAMRERYCVTGGAGGFGSSSNAPSSEVMICTPFAVSASVCST